MNGAFPQVHHDQKFLDSAHKAAQPARFNDIPRLAPSVLRELSAWRKPTVSITLEFKGVELVITGEYTPDSDGYCDNGGFDIESICVEDVDVLPLICAADVTWLGHECMRLHELSLGGAQ
jgi:hypothetical protein